jgi:cytochrome c oxidase assembly protein subunit 11
MTTELQRKNRRILGVALSIVAAMVLLVAYAPILYEKFCEITGYGGTVAETSVVRSAAAASTATEEIIVRFDANVAPDLPWHFHPEKPTIKARLGESITTHYVAENRSPETIVARAVFNVTPFKAAPHFFKTECFCFTEQKLGPGQKAEMPLVVYVDESLLRDKHASDVKEITLSYTFFRVKKGEDIEKAEDLVKGSEERRKRLEAQEEMEFKNDAPRR